MASQLILPPATPIFDNGVVEAGAQMFVYETGTTTEVNIFSDNALTAARANPVIANGNGVFPSTYWDNATTVRIVIKDSDGADISDTDPYVVGGGGGSGSAESVEWVSVHGYLTAAQIAAVTSFDASEDITVALQAAIDGTHANNENLFLPAGRYNISSTLIFPGTENDRNQSWRMRGVGFGELFARGFDKGTIIACGVNTPLFRTTPTIGQQGVGGVHLEHIRFEQTNAAATAVVLKMESLLDAYIEHCGVFQNGVGNGIEVDFCPLGAIRECRVMTGLWPSGADRSSATNTGIWIRNIIDGGLMQVERCTSRGWNLGYAIGDASGQPSDAAMISTVLRDNEVSTCNNGIRIYPLSENTYIENTYIEGADGVAGSFAIFDEGRYTTVVNSQIFPAHAIGIHAKGVRGATYIGNLISMGTATSAAANPIGYKLENVAAGVQILGGEVVVNNSLGNVANAKAIEVTGVNARVSATGVFYNPSTWDWTGASEVDISGVTGRMVGQIDEPGVTLDAPIWRGGINLTRHSGAITQTSVSGNNLTLSGGSYFDLTPTSAISVNQLSVPAQSDGKVVVLNLTNSDTTLTDSSLLQLTGNKSLVGPAQIALICRQINTTQTFYEIGRHKADGVSGADKVAAVADLNQTISGAYSQAEVQAISDKVDALLAAMRTAGVLTT